MGTTTQKDQAEGGFNASLAHGLASLDDLVRIQKTRQLPLLGGIIFDFDNTLATLSSPHAQFMEEGARTAQSYMESTGMELFPEFWEQIIDARLFAAKKSEEEEEEHIANDTMSFLLQFCGYPASRMDEKVLHASVELFYAPEMTGWKLADGVLPTLEELQAMGLKLAIVANYPCERVFQRTIDYLQLRPYFDMILCSASVEWRKPNPEIFQPILDRWDLQPYEAAVVGDSMKHDVYGGHQLGTMTVHCRIFEPDPQMVYDDEQLTGTCQPDAEVDDFRQLTGIARSWL